MFVGPTTHFSASSEVVKSFSISAETCKVWNFDSDQVAYYHSHSATKDEMEKAAAIDAIFEIDLCWAHSSFHPNITKDAPYIGHPEEFYTILEEKFPADNVSLDEFRSFVAEHPSMRVLIDIKDVTVFPYLEELINEIGPERCIVHAFIKDWTIIPQDTVTSQKVMAK